MMPEVILAHLADMLTGKAKKNQTAAVRAAEAGISKSATTAKGVLQLWAIGWAWCTGWGVGCMMA